MKKYLLIIYFISLFFLGQAQPRITNLSSPKSVDLYGLYEIQFQMGAYDNPYDPEVIDVYAELTGPDSRTRRVIGFYHEGYQFTEEKNYEVSSRERDGDSWRIRFTPDKVGQWTYVIHAIDKKGETQTTSRTFACQPKDADGFITIANTRFLKRDVFRNGRPTTTSFFPIGPNIAWYTASDYGKYKKPYGIYEYDRYIQQLSGKANYMRIWLNRYQFLSLYGPEHAGTLDGKPQMYFDKTLNQKDAAELDHIVAYAQEHGITLMACIFNFRNFEHKSGTANGTKEKPSMPSDWINNPYNTVLGLESKYDFFTDQRAIRIEKNLIRYIVARWGHATNLLCWELWNEVANMDEDRNIPRQTQREMVEWHRQMAEYIRSIDPYQHPVTTSLGSGKDISILYDAFDFMDIVQEHNYQNIQKSASKEQFTHVLYQETEKARESYPDKPFFMGEFGFGQGSSKATYDDKDPRGVDLHNSLWASAFSGSMGPASFWYWETIDKNNWYAQFKPVLTFMDNLPKLSDSFTASHTGSAKGRLLVFPNHLQTYYMANADEDTLMGWSQDTAFCYQSLRWLAHEKSKSSHFVDMGVVDPDGYLYTLDPARRPTPSSSSNRIVLPIKEQPRGTQYQVRWFDAETGLELTDEATTVTVRRPLFRSKRITIDFPSSIRDINGGRINNTYGDAVFIITKIK